MSWTKSKSFALSRILVEVTFGLLICMLFLIPSAVEWYDLVSNKEPVALFLGTILYLCDIAAFPIMLALYKLLKNIGEEKVFIEQNAKYLRFISWGLVVISLILLVFMISRPFVIAFSFIFAFLGLILRVVKNVFEEAISLQQEQDFTI